MSTRAITEALAKATEETILARRHSRPLRSKEAKPGSIVIQNHVHGLYTGRRIQDDVVLITMTEFGRTVRQNGSRGTDHGRGSCLFVLGNSVDGGKVHGTVPVLATENLADGRDLPVTTDFRSVFSEVAGKHLNIKPEDDAKLFPGWTGQRLPLIKS